MFGKVWVVYWAQYYHLQKGDIVYIYSSSPDSCVKYKLIVEEHDVQYGAHYDHEEEFFVDKNDFEKSKEHNRFVLLKFISETTSSRLSSHRYETHTKTNYENNEYPHWQDIPKEIPAFMTYARTCVPHPDGKRFAAFYSRFKRWRLFDASLNLISEVDVRIDPYEADAALEVAEQPIYYIGQPYATDEYIYVLCSNKNTSKDGRSELQVWDWEGNAVACYTFDRRLSLMAICEKYGRIYAIDNQVEDQMFVYDLPKNDKQMRMNL